MSGKWIKICGMTDANAVAAARDARVNAIGFVFAPSLRRVMPAAAARLAQPVRGRLECVAVTRHPEQSLVDEILREFEPDVLQTDAEDLAGLRLPRELGLLPVLRAGARVTQAGCGASGGPVLPSRLLFEGPVSGTGTTADWHEAYALARRAQLVLAGGLTAQNVTAAIARVEPFGVDVSSGVELSPGVKSPDLIAEFAAAARSAFEETGA